MSNTPPAIPALAAPAAFPSSHYLGLACGAGAGALWGLVFLAPELVAQFGPLHQSAGRYLCFGLIAAVLLAPRWRALAGQLPRRQWLHLAWLALTGNTLYYLLLAQAVQSGGIAITSLVIGFLPVAITLIGSREHGAVGLGRLLPSLALSALGAVCIGWQALDADSPRPIGAQLLGITCAVGALVCWTLFVVGNARALRQLRQVSAADWNLLIGIVAGAQSLLLIPFALQFETSGHGLSDWALLGLVSAGVAVLASILGNGLWNQMSRLLPLTLAGQMILFETFFALLYGFVWESRLPTLAELLALCCVVLGVISCLAAHRPQSGSRATAALPAPSQPQPQPAG